jgi:methylenetetrahydrofolate reductase (NADPH)
MTNVSFEFFPPRSPEAEQRLWDALDRLAPLGPAFVTVTCGAGGSATEVTLEALRRISARTSVPVGGHLTCVGRTREETDAEVLRYLDAGVRHIVALRGDSPVPGEAFRHHPGGYASAVELVAGIRRIAPLEISVAAYPEPHPDSVSRAKDLEVLARKADAGATRAITQFCFDLDAIIALRDLVDRAGIALNVVPGIMLATDYSALSRMAKLCGATLPGWLGARFGGLEDDLQTRKLVAAIVAAEQVQRLRSEGFDDFHFYTLNQGELAAAVCRLLEAQPALPQAVAA